MRAKLSSTLAGMALLQFLFLFLVLCPLFSKRPLARLSFEDAASALDERGSNGLEKNTVRRSSDHGACAGLDVVLLSQPARNNYLAFCGEPNGVGFGCRAH